MTLGVRLPHPRPPPAPGSLRSPFQWPQFDVGHSFPFWETWRDGLRRAPSARPTGIPRPHGFLTAVERDGSTKAKNSSGVWGQEPSGGYPGEGPPPPDPPRVKGCIVCPKHEGSLQRGVFVGSTSGKVLPSRHPTQASRWPRPDRLGHRASRSGKDGGAVGPRPFAECCSFSPTPELGLANTAPPRPPTPASCQGAL